MNITIIKIERCLPENIVMEVWFDASKTVDGVTATLSTSFQFMRDGNTSMIAWADITEAIVKGWITDRGIEDMLDDELRRINNPPTAFGLPWE